MAVALPLDEESKQVVSTLLKGSMSKHVFNFINWDPVLVYLHRRGWGNCVVRSSVWFNEGHV